MGKIVYVTGAPATGKSTLCRFLTVADQRIKAFCYSERLRDYVNSRANTSLDEVDIRRQSAKAITAEDVAAVDDSLSSEVAAARESAIHLLIDSHPVTKEDYGFRVTPFSVQRLQQLGIDSLICLYASPALLAERISADAQGRPLPSGFELALHVELQAAVVSQYSVLAGIPCHLLDASVPREALAATVRRLTSI